MVHASGINRTMSRTLFSLSTEDVVRIKCAHTVRVEVAWSPNRRSKRTGKFCRSGMQQ